MSLTSCRKSIKDNIYRKYESEILFRKEDNESLRVLSLNLEIVGKYHVKNLSAETEIMFSLRKIFT